MSKKGDTLDEEIEGNIIEEVKKLFNIIRVGDVQEMLVRTSDLIEVLQILHDRTKTLHDMGIRPLKLVYTGEKVGNLRIFKADDNDEEFQIP